MSKHYQSPEAYLSGMIRQGYIPAKDILPPPEPTVHQTMPVIGHVPTADKPRPESPLKYVENLQKTPDKRKFQKGNRPCGRCTANHHADCKPRRDGTLCTCSCSLASAMRLEHALAVEEAAKGEEPMPSIKELTKLVYKRKLRWVKVATA